MNVLSLFDGMGCLYISLIEAGFKINKYYASEIEKKPIEFTKKNFPDIEHLGDVRNVDVSKLGKIDIVGGGSPCTDLSFAGKQSGLICNTLEDYLELRNEWIKTGNEDLYFHNGKFQQSILFWEYVRILRELQEINPDVVFLLENVVMSKQNQKIINDTLGIFPVRINSNKVSAQNRDRLYWANIKTKQIGLFGELNSDIPQPEDQGILLKDILQPESEIDEKYYIKNPKINLSGLDILKKAPTQRSSTGRCLDKKHNYQIINLDKDLNKKPNQDKASCFTAGGNSGGNHSDMDIICVAMRGRNIENGKRNDYKGAPTEQRLEPNFNGKTNCITSVQKDNLIMQINPSKESGGNQPYQQNRIYNPDGQMPALTAELGGRNNVIIQKPRGFNKGGFHKEKAPTLTSNSWEQNNILHQDIKFRRLTPFEVMELQTIPKWVSREGFSDTAIYKMCGNGQTIKVMSHILSYIKL